MLEAELERAATRVIREVTGIEPASAGIVLRGVMTWKVEVALSSGERFIVRFYPPGREHVVRVEPDLLRRALAADLPVPEVVADSRAGPAAPHPYLCYRRLDGEPLDLCWGALGEAERATAAGALVALIARMHALPMAGYGELVSPDRGRDDDAGAFLARTFQEGLGAARRHGLFAADLLEDLAAVQRGVDALGPGGAVGLVWGDVSAANTLVDGNARVVGLLDFEGALAGERVANLGYCLAGQDGTSFHQAVADAWPDEEASRADLWAVVRALRLATWAHRPRLPAGADRDPIESFLPGLAPAAARLRQRCRTGP